MASNTDETFAQYKLYAGIAIGGVLLAAVLDSCTAPTKEEIAAAKEAEVAAVEAKQAEVESAATEMEESLKPIETMAVMEKSAAPAAPRSGAEVYQAACMACHAAGVLNAPKLEPGAWDGRIDKGIDGLTQTAISGINSMPPRGGNPAISDEEMKNAVTYMLAESGYDTTEGATAGGKAEAKSAVADAAIEEVKAAAEAAKAAAEAAKASATEARAAAEAAKTAASDTQAAAEEAKSAANTTQAALSGMAQTVTQPATQSAATDAQAMEIVQTTSADSVGKQVYESTCFTCHDVGIFGSPMLSDKAAWNERISAGIDALYATAINGDGTTKKPAKGGHPDLSEAQVKAAVDYMLDTAGVDMAADAGTTAVATQEAKAETATDTAQETKPAAEATTEEAAEETKPEAATEEKSEEAAEETQSEAEAAEEKPEEAAEETKPEAEAAEEKSEEAAQETQSEAATTEEKSEAADAAQDSAAAAPAWASIDGEKVYRGICFSCHDSGIAEAPILGKATAWEARMAAGIEAMYINSINGKGVMPPKGGNPALSDDEIRAAVDWMVEQIQ